MFAGCSFTAGHGWLPGAQVACKDSSYLWVNLCHQNINKFQNLDLINVGQGGASNTQIFENTIEAIARHQNNIDTIIVQWTAMPRYCWNVGFELWDTSEALAHDKNRVHDHHLSNGTVYTQNYITDLRNRLLATHHLHWEILKLLRYADILSTSCANYGIHCFFVNGICPWDREYFTRLHNAMPEDYTSFTKKEILDIDHRSDQDIIELYTRMHNAYDQYPIQSTSWINLYDSFYHNRIDFNYDDQHPGVKSNQIFCQIVKKFIDLQPV